MASIGLTEAAKLTGKSPSTITRRSNHKDSNKRLSFTANSNGDRLYDVAELERVFGKLRVPDEEHAIVQKTDNAPPSNPLHEEIILGHQRENALLQEQITQLRAQVDDLKQDRDEWRTQAKQSTLFLEDQREKETELKHALKEAQSAPEVKRSWWGRVVYRKD